MQAMPMHQILGTGFVQDVDVHRLAFPHAQQRSGRQSVVAGGFYDPLGGELYGDGSDANCEIGFRRRGLGPGRHSGSGQKTQRVPAVHTAFSLTAIQTGAEIRITNLRFVAHFV